ncbi:dolichyl-phosphate-mannose--protein O-mannosyl transferase [Microbacterium resistens]|uniref:Polyprenol-phosphate-mannose--protein mannosyltransferase n=1 Tax=Microbacterium resistens TaxID=156977 RepID=A0ABU1S7Y3_9MICO|nr:phospholipid carrier-dependent glycosyltransferase [Microbacterium resistens]MDR6865727.1 dolichyl-phosphate-mannose--protein O-mannosyl transferase [Microbacterium resistens]
MTAPLLPPVDLRPTRWERVRDAWILDPRRHRLLSWLAPTLLMLLAAVLRIPGIGSPHTLAFDETYYVKDAWSLWAQGYEGEWGENHDELFNEGVTTPLKTTGSFVVHPPLGKWIIALGMGLLGPGSSVGWRLMTAVAGVLTVLVIYLVARELTRSIVVASIAGLFLAVDGLAIVLSRIALLDGILSFFILLGFLFVLIDRRRTMPILEDPRTHAGTDGAQPLWGRVLWRRPWILAAGAALGAATAVKWSGMYALAALGLYLVVTDALARRRAGISMWPTDAALRQGPVSFLLLVPPALLVYLASWTGWLVTAGGYSRPSDPNPLIALWKYHEVILNFHVNLTSTHPYASPAWQWPLLLRPTAVWVGGQGEPCPGSDNCIATISSIPNPVLWYLGVAAALYLLFRLVRGLIDRAPMPWTHAIPLVGLAGTYVPWLMFPERTIFQFYTVAMLPFLILALVLALKDVAGPRSAPVSQRKAGQRTVAVVVIVVLLVSAFFYPLWVGMAIPYDFWVLHNWMTGWV